MLLRLLVLILPLAASLAAAELPPDHAQRMERGLQTFSKRIKPLLIEQCLECHGGAKTKSEFDLATREALLAGGAEGKAVVPFKASESRLLKLVRHEEEPHMPEKKPKLSSEALDLLAAWINDGAPYESPLVDGKLAAKKGEISEADRKWWAFQPLKDVIPPVGRAKNPVDRFVAAKAAEKRLSLAPAAEKRVLIRRLYLDLHGLPPTPEEIEAFLKDRSPDAWPRLIDRALDSPHYGERWARHWLDVARFAESSGFEHDYDREGAYQFRDFVIRAFNADMPFDQFLRWQLAGDEFAPDNPQALAATGFLGAGVFPTQITANEVERTRYDAMDDMLSTTSLAFLGLTVGCARCHDHKFDPIPAADYYRMLSTFTTTARSVVELDIDPARQKAEVDKWTQNLASLRIDLAVHEAALKKSFKPGEEDFDAWKKKQKSWADLSKKMEAHEKKKPSGLSKALICAEGYKPLRMHTQGGDFFNETYFLKRGNTDLKDGVASPDFLQVLKREKDTARWQVKPPEGAKFSGRRAALAQWMTDMEAGAGPLVARVAVNRLWQHHFGQGIVATPNDFGRTGAAPTHPELLDWLATELVKAGWKLKPIHKLLLTSATYQQTTAPDRFKVAADPDNKLFVRRLPRRLEGEALRDSILAVSGKLDRAMFGPGTMDERSVRRSIYFTVKRSQLVNSMVVFDLPEPLVSQGARPVTTVAPQALLIMNGPQVREWAAAFAERLVDQKSTGAKVTRAFELALGRRPTRQEQKQSVDFIDQHEKPSEALVDFCQVIFGLNEFAYER